MATSIIPAPFGEYEDFKSSVTQSETLAVGSSFIKQGNHCMITLKGEDKVHAANDQLFTLPAGYRPAVNIYFPFVKNANTFGVARITSGGVCTIVALNDATKTGRVYFCVDYIC